MDIATGENEKRLLAATVRDRLIGNKNTILFGELLDKKIPTFLKNYLQNSVQKYIYTEEPIQFNNSKRFDFDYCKISDIKKSLVKAFEEATIFWREELIEIINRTVRLQFNLLVKPQKTLLKIFYRNRSERIQNDILQILEGLDDQRVIIQRLIVNIRDFDQYHIVEEDFKKILDATNKKVYQENFIESFISDVVAFTKFLSMIHGYETKSIDINLINLLLTERNLNQFCSAFKTFPENKIEIDQIAYILGRSRKDEEPDIEDDEIEKFMMVSVSDDQGDNSVEKNSNLYKDEINHSFKDLEPNNDNSFRSEESLNERAIDELTVTRKERKVPKITNMWKDPMDMVITRSKIEKQPDGPLHSLRVLIDEKDKKFIQKRIFDNDHRAYYQFIGQLEPVDNWKEAKRIIDNELFMRSVEPFSKEALRLGDLVFNRYFPKRH